MIDLEGFADLVNELRAGAAARARRKAGHTGKAAVRAGIHAELAVLPALALELAAVCDRGRVAMAFADVAVAAGIIETGEHAGFAAAAADRLFATPVNPNPPACEL